MSLLTIKARVSQYSEEYLEEELLGKLDELPLEKKEPYLVWRKVTIRSEQVREIQQYDAEKSLVLTYDGDKYLVKETHKLVDQRWREANKTEKDYYGESCSEEPEEDFNNEEDED